MKWPEIEVIYGRFRSSPLSLMAMKFSHRGHEVSTLVSSTIPMASHDISWWLIFIDWRPSPADAPSPESEGKDDSWQKVQVYILNLGVAHNLRTHIWLVVGPPLWKIWTSIGMIRNSQYMGQFKKNGNQTTNQTCLVVVQTNAVLLVRNQSTGPGERTSTVGVSGVIRGPNRWSRATVFVEVPQNSSTSESWYLEIPPHLMKFVSYGWFTRWFPKLLKGYHQW